MRPKRRFQCVGDHDFARSAILAHVPRLARPLDATLSIRRSTAKDDIVNTSDDPQFRAWAKLPAPSGKSGRIGSKMTGSAGVSANSGGTSL
jgi:hypothetical protein